jgi:hypothetical protein
VYGAIVALVSRLRDNKEEEEEEVYEAVGVS